MAKDEIIVIGGANIDIKAKADAALVGATSNPGVVRCAMGGVARNIAHNLAKLGVAVALVTAVSDDAHGRDLTAEAKASGIDMSLSLTSKAATGVYVVILDEDGEMALAVSSMPGMDELSPDWLENHAARLDSARFILADCNLPQATLAWLARYGEKLIVEPVSVQKCRKIEAIDKPIFAATPNRQQAEMLIGLAIRSVSGALSAAQSLHRSGIDHVALSFGEQGVVIAGKDISPEHIPPVEIPASSIRDVTGAGDAATAGLVFGLLNGFSFAQAARLGQAAAALTLASSEAVAEVLTRDRLISLASARSDFRQ